MSTVSTSALGSLLSSLNNGSAGLDVTSAVASIIAAERAPETAWQNQQTTINSQATEIHQLESEISAVTVQLQSLGDPISAFGAVAATSSNSNIVTASAVSGTATGTHTITVNKLAATGSYYSAEQSSSSSALPSDTFSITQGGTTTSFTVGGSSGVDTLDQLASAINNSSAGVNASVVSDSNGSRLALVAKGSGTAADFSVSSDSTFAFQQGTPGADASVTIDGVPVTSATNTVAGAINGLTLNLQAQAPSTPVTITLAPDTTTIQNTLSTFVSSYNTLIKDLNAQFTFNGSTSTEGVLSADSTARSLQSDVLNAANLNIGSGAIQNLASLGITTGQDGTLVLNSQALSQALSTNFQGVVSFFQGSSGAAGYASTLVGTLNSYTDPSQGSFTVDLQSSSNEYKDLASQIDRYEIYIATQQTLLTQEYNNANIALQQLPEKMKQINALLGNNNNSSSN